MKKILLLMLFAIAVAFTFVSCSSDENDAEMPTLSISDDGFWVINGDKTDVKAEGTKGDTGSAGPEGATGPQGAQGVGIRSVELIDGEKLLITFTDNSTQTVEIPHKEEHVHNFSEWQSIFAEDGISCEKRTLYRSCLDCNQAEIRKGAKSDHSYPDSYLEDEYSHWKQCLICGAATQSEAHESGADKRCIVCDRNLSCVNRIIESGKLVVGMECSYQPYNWTTATPTENTVPISNFPGSYADGYDVQIAKRIANALGVELVIKAIEWDNLIPALKAGAIDMIIAGMTPTEDRKQEIDFSNAYYNTNLVIVVEKNSAYADADDIRDFSGASLTAQVYSEDYAVIDQINGVNKYSALDVAALIPTLESGAIDGFVCGKLFADNVVAAHEDLTYVEFAKGKGFECSPEEFSIAVGVCKGSDAVDEINEALASFTQEDMDALLSEVASRQP